MINVWFAGGVYFSRRLDCIQSAENRVSLSTDHEPYENVNFRFCVYTHLSRRHDFILLFIFFFFSYFHRLYNEVWDIACKLSGVGTFDRKFFFFFFLSQTIDTRCNSSCRLSGVLSYSSRPRPDPKQAPGPPGRKWKAKNKYVRRDLKLERMLFCPGPPRTKSGPDFEWYKYDFHQSNSDYWDSSAISRLTVIPTNRLIDITMNRKHRLINRFFDQKISRTNDSEIGSAIRPTYWFYCSIVLLFMIMKI